VSDSEATLATQIYRRLRDDLLDGRLQPGVKLKVQNIAAEYGVGASPIREALSSLAAEGLVQRLDQRGFRAASATLAEFEELLRARCRLEEIVLRESIAAGGTEWEEALVLANYRLARLGRAETPHSDREWDEAHQGFHEALLGASPSTTLLAFCRTLRERSIRYRNIAKAIAGPPRDTASEHEGITQAALARKTEEACRRLVEHYMTAGEYVRLALAGGAPVDEPLEQAAAS
jgi:GntR family carbon starvation induced transcriptional regulator